MDEYPRDRPEDSPSDAMTLPSLAFMCGLFGDLLTHSIILSCIWLSSIDCWDLGGGGGGSRIYSQKGCEALGRPRTESFLWIRKELRRNASHRNICGRGKGR